MEKETMSDNMNENTNNNSKTDHGTTQQAFDQLIAGHDYDGIQEFDNPLPMWWLWTFLGTIIFSFIYYIHYELKIGPTSDQELSAEMQNIEKIKSMAETNSPKVDLNNLIKDEGKIAEGKLVFGAKCGACHGDKGQGLVGPNLTDKAWINGSTIESIYKTIAKGVLEKGMPPWEGVLKDTELQNVALFVHSIKGTNVTGGKAAEGVESP